MSRILEPVTIRVAVASVFALLASGAGCVLAQGETPREIVVTGATIVDVRTGELRTQDILIRDERIAELRPGGSLAARRGARVVDGKGRYVVPGLWDMHIHATTEPELADRVSVLLVANGVTGIRDTGGPLDRVLAFRAHANRPDTLAPRTRVAGPTIDGVPHVRPGPSPDTVAEAVRLIDTFADRGVDFIKLYEMLRPEVFAAAAARAHERGLRVIAHVPARMSIAAALDAGLDEIEHLRGVEFDCARDPASLLAQRIAIIDAYTGAEGGFALRRKVHAQVRPVALADQDAARCTALIQSFVERGTWHTPTLNIVAFRSLGFHADPLWMARLRYLSPALQEKWRKRLEEYLDESAYPDWKAHGEWAMRMVGEMHRAGVKLLAGTDTPAMPVPPGFGLHDELEALTRAGVSPLGALQAATLNAAEFFGDGDLGAIEAGKLGDVVLLDANPLADIRNTRRIAAVILKGQAYERAALDELLAALEAPRQAD